MKPSDALQAYILRKLEIGVGIKELKEETLRVGWSYPEVDAALRAAEQIQIALHGQVQKERWVTFLAMLVGFGTAYASFVYHFHRYV